MKNVYIIDACALIDAAKHYMLNKKTFSSIWEKLEDLIREGVLISSIEVKDEVKDEDIATWLSRNSNMFIPLTEEVQKETIKILRDYPRLIKLTSKGNSNADPFLLATAILYNAIIVTNETPAGENATVRKIPDVCKSLDIGWMNLNEFISSICE